MALLLPILAFVFVFFYILSKNAANKRLNRRKHGNLHKLVSRSVYDAASAAAMLKKLGKPPADASDREHDANFLNAVFRWAVLNPDRFFDAALRLGATEEPEIYGKLSNPKAIAYAKSRVKSDLDNAIKSYLASLERISKSDPNKFAAIRKSHPL